MEYTVGRNKMRASIVLAAAIVLGLVGVVKHDRVGEFVWNTFHNETIAFWFTSDDTVLKSQAAAYYFNGGAYDFEKSKQYYLELFQQGQRDSVTLYQLGRIYFSEGDFVSSIRMLDLQLELYPNEKRAYYIRGLAYLYHKQFEEAQESFEQFVMAYPDEWAGHNDLSWAYFKGEQYERSVEAALTGLEQFPENMWLHNMAGISLWNSGDLVGARAHLEKANELAQHMTALEWRKAYPGNDPATDADSLAAMKVLVEENLRGVEAELAEQGN